MRCREGREGGKRGGRRVKPYYGQILSPENMRALVSRDLVHLSRDRCLITHISEEVCRLRTQLSQHLCCLWLLKVYYKQLARIENCENRMY